MLSCSLFHWIAAEVLIGRSLIGRHLLVVSQNSLSPSTIITLVLRYVAIWGKKGLHLPARCGSTLANGIQEGRLCDYFWEPSCSRQTWEKPLLFLSPGVQETSPCILSLPMRAGRISDLSQTNKIWQRWQDVILLFRLCYIRLHLASRLTLEAVLSGLMK